MTMSSRADDNSVSPEPTTAANDNEAQTLGVDDIPAQITSSLSPNAKGAIQDADTPSLAELPQDATSESGGITNDPPASQEARIEGTSQNQQTENTESSAYQKPYVESLASGESDDDEWNKGQHAGPSEHKRSIPRPYYRYWEEDETDDNASVLSAGTRLNQYTDSLSIEELSDKQSNEQSEDWDFESSDWSDDFSTPSRRSSVVHYNEVTIPQHNGNSSTSVNQPPPICRPLPDGTFRNPFTSSKQDVMAMFEAANAAKNAGKRMPWSRWLREDKRSTERSRAPTLSTNYRRRHDTPNKQVPAKDDTAEDYYYGTYGSYGPYTPFSPLYVENPEANSKPIPPPPGRVPPPPDVGINHSSTLKNIVTVNLQPSSFQKPNDLLGPVSQSWILPEFELKNGWQTQLLTMSSIEHYYDVFGKSMATITKLDQSKVNESVSRTYWLNIQLETLSLGILKEFVYRCPYIQDAARSLTIQLLHEQETQRTRPSIETDSSEFRTAIRYDGTMMGLETNTSVTFITTSYLALMERQSGPSAKRGGEYRARTLAQTLYHYEPEDHITGISQPTVYQDIFDRKKAVFVPQMWCLLIDPNIIVTMSPLSCDELAGSHVEIEDDPLASQARRIVLIQYDNSVMERRSIACDFKFSDILRVASQIRGHDSLTNLVVEQSGAILTEEIWRDLLNQDGNHEIKLNIQPNPPVKNSLLHSIKSISSLRNNIKKTSQERVTNDENPEQEQRPSTSTSSNRSQNYSVPLQSIEGQHDAFSATDKGKSNQLPIRDFRDNEMMPNDTRPASPDYSTMSKNIEYEFGSYQAGRGAEPEYEMLPARSIFNETPYAARHYLSPEDRNVPISGVLGSSSINEEFQSNELLEPRTGGSPSTQNRREPTISIPEYGNTSLVLHNRFRRSRSRTKTSTLPTHNKYSEKTSFASEPAFPPLFTWERKKGVATNNRTGSNTGNIRKTLAKVHRSLQSNKSTAYLRSRECTRNEFARKHPRVIQYVGHPGKNAARKDKLKTPSAEASRGDPSPIDLSNPGTGHKSTKKTVAFQNSNPLANKPRSPRVTRSKKKSGLIIGDSIVQSSLTFTLLAQRFLSRSSGSSPELLTVQDNVRSMEANIENLSLISAKFINTFLPEELVDTEVVTQKIWGSVEEIARQAELSFTLVDPSESEAWSIRYDPGRNEKKAWGTCNRCRNDEQDTTLQEALQHFHSHMSQEDHEDTYKPHEDPCIIWLQAHHSLRDDRWRQLIQPKIKSFISIISELQQEISEIANRCARPTAEGLAEGDLPENLVFAFEAMVALYCLAAEEITRINGDLLNESTNSMDPIRSCSSFEESVEWPERFKEFEARANDLLEQAQKDIIFLDIADKKPRHSNLETVGREFLLGVMLTNLHDRPLDTTVEATDHVDIITPYKRLASRLQYLVHNRPKKRLFIELTTFSRELEALRKLVGCQIESLQKIIEVTDPKSGKGIRGNRLVQYQLECECIENLQAKLYHTEYQVDQLQRKVADLKVQIVQVLEILEEGHGKAIRVFTIVTIFFLPLSFVTSFLGMNTTDIRDTDNNSSLFWLVAIPFTAGVVSLAFLYGYKWDDIWESISRVQARRQIARETTQNLSTVENSTIEQVNRWSTASQRVSQTFRDFDGAVRRRTTAALRRQSLPRYRAWSGGEKGMGSN